MTDSDSPPTPLLGPAALEQRLAALEAAVASLGEVHLTHDHDGLESFRQWYEQYQEDSRAIELGVPPRPEAGVERLATASDPLVGVKT